MLPLHGKKKSKPRVKKIAKPVRNIYKFLWYYQFHNIYKVSVLNAQ